MPALWPTDSKSRAEARSISAEMHAGFGTLRQSMPMDLKQRHPAPAPNPALEADIARIGEIWRECRARHSEGGPFLFGRFSIPDAMYAPVVTRFETYGVALDPVCRAYADAILAWPAMQEWRAAAREEPWTITW